MKKFLSIMLALSLALPLLAGCASQSGSPVASSGETTTAPATSGAPEGEEPVTITWALWDWEATTYYKPLIDAYREKHPYVTIQYVDLGSTDYSIVLSTQLTGGDDSLDVITIKDMPGYSNLVNANHLEPLNDIVAEKGIDTSLYGGITEQLSIDGKLYSLPFRSDFWIIYYNKDLFDAADVPYPTNDMTFEEYDRIARLVTNDKSGAEKVYGAHYHIWRSAVQLFGILDGKHTIVDGTYDFLKPYYEMVLKQQDDDICQDYATLKTSSAHYSGVFYNNSVAMMNMGSWFIPTLISKINSGEAESKNWGIVKYPHAEGVEAGTTLGTITGLSVSAASKKKAAALDFLTFVTGEEGAKVVAETGSFPAIKSNEVVDLISSMDGFPADENSKEALKTAKTYLEMPVHERVAEIETILNASHDSIMTKNLTIDEGIKEMNDEVGALLK